MCVCVCVCVCSCTVTTSFLCSFSRDWHSVLSFSDLFRITDLPFLLRLFRFLFVYILFFHFFALGVFVAFFLLLLHIRLSILGSYLVFRGSLNVRPSVRPCVSFFRVLCTNSCFLLTNRIFCLSFSSQV